MVFVDGLSMAEMKKKPAEWENFCEGRKFPFNYVRVEECRDEVTAVLSGAISLSFNYPPLLYGEHSVGIDGIAETARPYIPSSTFL